MILRTMKIIYTVWAISGVHWAEIIYPTTWAPPAYMQKTSSGEPNVEFLVISWPRTEKIVDPGCILLPCLIKLEAVVSKTHVLTPVF